MLARRCPLYHRNVPRPRGFILRKRVGATPFDRFVCEQAKEVESTEVDSVNPVHDNPCRVRRARGTPIRCASIHSGGDPARGTAHSRPAAAGATTGGVNEAISVCASGSGPSGRGLHSRISSSTCEVEQRGSVRGSLHTNCEHRDLSVGKIKLALLLGVIALLEQQIHNDYGKETLYVVAGERGPCIKVSMARDK
jgi:hypothetical protein